MSTEEKTILREEIGAAVSFTAFIVCCILMWMGTP
jgi:hypothetical protein